METYTHSTIAMLAVINPFVTGAMLLQVLQGQDNKSNIIAMFKVMGVVLVILLASAIGGKYILSAFGISMDAFQVVGGVIISFIGFKMLGGTKGRTNGDQKGGLTSLIFFAAGPGSITMVITLSAIHNTEDLPLAALVGTTLAVVITVIIIILMELLAGIKKIGGQGIISKYMGLLIVAMGLQILLTGIKHFFGI